jgi:hypothetical protein
VKTKFLHYIFVNAASQLSLDKNADTYAFTTCCFFSGYKQKCAVQCFAVWYPLLVWSSFTADKNILYLNYTTEKSANSRIITLDGHTYYLSCCFKEAVCEAGGFI